MRITGGAAKGRRLQFPSGSKERPTSDFLREALFNILGSLDKKTFLDLFAGSGSVGLEAASRGVQKVYFVEKNPKLAAVIGKNILDICRDVKSCIMASDIEPALRDLFKSGCRFDMIFADPPYNRNLAGKTVECLSRYRVLKEDGLLIVQHSVKENFDEYLRDHIHPADKRKYGENVLTFLKWRKNDAG